MKTFRKHFFKLFVLLGLFSQNVAAEIRTIGSSIQYYDDELNKLCWSYNINSQALRLQYSGSYKDYAVKSLGSDGYYHILFETVSFPKANIDYLKKNGYEIKSLTVSEYVADIPDNFLEGCSVESVTFEDSESMFVNGSKQYFSRLERIGKGAFQNCRSLKQLDLGSSFNLQICEHAFEGCSLLERINIHKKKFIFENQEIEEELEYYKLESYIVDIGNYAFWKCNSLKVVTIDDKRKVYIGDVAFADCRSLLLIDLDRVNSIGRSAFSGCKKLPSVILPECSSIGASAFSDCPSLKNVAILLCPAVGFGVFSQIAPNAILYTPYTEHFAHENFSEIKALSEFVPVTKIEVDGDIPFPITNKEKVSFKLRATTKPDNATFKDVSWSSSNEAIATVDQYGLVKTTGITGEVLISAIVDDCECGNVLTVYDWDSYIRPVDNIILNTTSVSFFPGFGYTLSATLVPEDANHYNPILYRSSNSSVAKVDSKGHIEAINPGTAIITVESNGTKATCEVVVKDGFFYDRETGNVTITTQEVLQEAPWRPYHLNLQNVTLGGQITSIPGGALSGCNLTSITISEGVTSIGVHAFYGCSSLASITIPESVTNIGEGAFSGCSSLTSVTIPKSVTSIVFRAFEGCNSLTSITISEGVTSIGGAAFSGCSSLTSITIPESVTSIGGAAFSGCSSLTSITIPKGVTSIGGSAFSGCSSLTSITIPEGVTSIGGAAFSGCSSLTSITIPEGVTSIGESAFASCSSLTSITIPEGVTSIGKAAFEGCSILTAINIPESVTSIAEYAFSGCSSLTAINIPEGVTKIPWAVFSECRSLTSITIPESVTDVDFAAFRGCRSLTSVTSLAKQAPTISNKESQDILAGCVLYYPYGSNYSSWARYFKRMEAVGKPNIPVSGISLSQSTLVLTEGDNFALTTTVTPDDATDKTVAWTSSNSLVATVNDGVVTAVAAGTATITAKAGDKTATCVVTVKAAVVNITGVSLNQSTLTLTEGDNFALTATVTPDDATDKTVTWTSSNSLVATVNDGVVTAIAAGTAIITAKAGDKTATCVVTVKAAVVNITGVSLNQSTLTLTKGNNFTLTATVTPNNATDKTVTWTSSNSSVATVNDGVVTAVAAGTAIITAKAGDKTATCVVTVIIFEGDDVTAMIDNPSFEGGTYDCGDGTGGDDLKAPEGWTVTYTNDYWGWRNFRPMTDGNQQDGNQYFEFWAYTYHTLDLSQEVRLPAGNYVLSAAMRTERADQVTNQHIYVKVNGKEIPSAVLGVPRGSAWNAVDAWQTLMVIFTLDTSSNVVIGATSTGGAGSAGWFQIDNFRLDYSKHSEDIVVSGITSISQLNNTNLYYVSQPQHSKGLTSWAVTEGGNALKSNVDLRLIPDANDTRQQFAFISNDGGATYYLYHAAEKKFVNKDGSLDCNPTDPIYFKDGAYENTFSAYFDNMHQINVGSSRQMVIDNWSTADGGNSCVIAPIASFDPTEILKAFFVEITGIILDKNSVEMVEGDNLQLIATVMPENATEKAVTWTSSNSSVATVNDGVVTAVAAGTAIITAKAGDKTATCVVTVKAAVVNITGVSLNQSTLTLTKGNNFTLTATVAPNNATDKTVTWRTTNSSVATVKNGVVTAVATGTAIIVATAGDKTATCVVTVKAATVITGISLNQSTLTLTKGNNFTLTATVTPNNATDKTVTWKTTNSSVAMVNDGVVTAVAAGTAIIVATAGSCTATCVVTVEAAEPEGLLTDRNYRVKNVSTGLYLQVSGNNTNMKLQNKAEGVELTQVFQLEDAGEGMYYIKAADSDNNYYAHASRWNFNATSNAANKTPFTIALVEGEVYTLHQSVSAYTGLVGSDASEAGSDIYCDKGVANNGKWSFEALTEEENAIYIAAIKGLETSIEKTIVNGGRTTVIYDLTGRRVTDTKGLKGIYIVNGKKVVIK